MKLDKTLLLCSLLSLAGLTVGFSQATAAADKEVVTPIQEVHRGQHVLLEGTVHRIKDTDEFVLQDATGKIDIYIGWKNRMPVTKGESVKVWGIADDDAFFGFRPEIYARSIELPSGKRIDLSRGDY